MNNNKLVLTVFAGHLWSKTVFLFISPDANGHGINSFFFSIYIAYIYEYIYTVNDRVDNQRFSQVMVCEIVVFKFFEIYHYLSTIIDEYGVHSFC